MSDYDKSNTSTTSLRTAVDDYSVDSQSLDVSQTKETVWSFPNATEYLGYYKSIPELKKAIDALVSWTVGKGFTCTNKQLSQTQMIRGWGKDNFQMILENMLIMKKVMGDSFAEIVTNDEGTIINLKPVSAERMKIVFDDKGVIIRYEERITKDEVKEYQPHEILHLSNDRIGDEIHGVSVIEACKWVIDARNEAMTDWRRISHRSTIRVIYVDIDNPTKLNQIKEQYQDGIKYGEVLVLPGKRGDMEIEDITLPPVDAFLKWIQYLENFFYQAVGVPRIILGGSEQFTEASSKIGYLTFEQVYITEQKKLEADLRNQLGFILEFTKPVSLRQDVQDAESKNAGQVGIQANDTQAGVGK